MPISRAEHTFWVCCWADGAQGCSLQLLSRRQLPQGLQNPNHAIRVQPAVVLQLLPDPLPLIVYDFPVRHPQELQTGNAAFLDGQLLVAATGQGGEHGP